MSKTDNTAKKKFEELLGKPYLKKLKEDFWISFSDKSGDIYGPEHYELNFMEKDGKRDTVIYLTFVYLGAEKKWKTETAAGDWELKFNTFKEAVEYYHTLGDELCEWGNSYEEELYYDGEA
jgi:hypothetical protein